MEQEIISTETNEAPKARRTRKTVGKKAPGRKTATKKAATGRKTKATKKSKPVTGNLVQADLSRYTRGEGTTPGGNQTLDIGDTVANKLRGKDLDAIYGLAAKALKVTVKELKDKYQHLNPGMQRMNLGNRMRAAAK